MPSTRWRQVCCSVASAATSSNPLHDGQGMCLFAERLERGRFIRPVTAGDAVTVTSKRFDYLLESID
ncbi:MAG: IS66 family insertion sequence element accessory protein TnpB [Rhizomicrobium sp.]